MFHKILIANRGEIVVRIIATCREMGIQTIALYSEADREARHAREADEVYSVGPAPAAQSYLRSESILDIARRSGAEAIHPGYGFLSENADFAEACEQAGITFIGPQASAMRLMGSKIAAKELAQSVDVPVVPGYSGEHQDKDFLLQEAQRIGFPLLIKASAGGGGKGMREVWRLSDFPAELDGAKREALASFGDDMVFLERLIQQPRHVEIQVLGDRYGNIIHLGERECSIQRRHQKIVEESPSVALTQALRAEMGSAAVRIARAAGYSNAGTVEFILDRDQGFYFLEMNTRLQVEHPVTEGVTGLDLVRHQLLIAAGERLAIRQEHGLTGSGEHQEASLPPEALLAAAMSDIAGEVKVRGAHRFSTQHGISDNPWRSMGPWRMVGSARTFSYHSLGKEHRVSLLPLTGAQSSSWCAQVDRQPAETIRCEIDSEGMVILQRGAERRRAYVQQGKGATQVVLDGREYRLERRQPPDVETATRIGSTVQKQQALSAPMAGTIVKVWVSEGEEVQAQQLLAILTAMKMEHAITAPHDGKVRRVLAHEGDVVKGGTVIVELEEIHSGKE